MLSLINSLGLVVIGCVFAAVCLVAACSAIYAIYKEINHGGLFNG